LDAHFSPFVLPSRALQLAATTPCRCSSSQWSRGSTVVHPCR